MTVERKRQRLQEERVELDDAGYLRADLRVTLLHHFDDDDAVVAHAKAAAPAPKPVAKAGTKNASAAAAVNARAA